MGSKGTGKPEEAIQFSVIRHMLAEISQEEACLSIKDLAIDGKVLQQAGFAPGPKMGRCLNVLLELVLDEQLPNETEALLRAAKNIWEELP